jgi:hypothetical protein
MGIKVCANLLDESKAGREIVARDEAAAVMSIVVEQVERNAVLREEVEEPRVEVKFGHAIEGLDIFDRDRAAFPCRRGTLRVRILREAGEEFLVVESWIRPTDRKRLKVDSVLPATQPAR